MSKLLFAFAGWIAFAGSAAADELRDAFAKSYELETAQQYDQAVMALNGPRTSTYLVNLRLGWLHYLRGDYAQSKQFYQAAMRMSPKAIEPRLGYTLPLMAERKYAELEVAAKAVMTMDAHHYTGSLRMTYALRMQGKLRPARDLNSEMLALYPTDVSFLTEQLLTSAALMQSDVAALRDTILLVDPTNATAKSFLPSGQ